LEESVLLARAGDDLGASLQDVFFAP